MGKIPEELKAAIACNIKAERIRKFGSQRGTSKKCAEEFKVSQQQWSPWEKGMRTPDETRLKEIAIFFGVDVEYLRRSEEQHPISYDQWRNGVRTVVFEPTNVTPAVEPSLPPPPESDTQSCCGNETPVDPAGVVLRQKQEARVLLDAIWNLVNSGIRVSFVIEKSGITPKLRKP